MLPNCVEFRRCTASGLTCAGSQLNWRQHRQAPRWRCSAESARNGGGELAAMGDTNTELARQVAELRAAVDALRREPRGGVPAAAGDPPRPTEWVTKLIELVPHPRGCHVITAALLRHLPEVAGFEAGLVHLFLQHTSASLTVNENASPDVPLDLADALDRLAPDGDGSAGAPRYRHDDEGPDDMPAHVKSSLMGPGLTLPIAHGRVALGTWQGIYLNEHRNYGGPRRVCVTIQGQRRADGRTYGTHI